MRIRFAIAAVLMGFPPAFAATPAPETAREFRKGLRTAEPAVGCHTQAVIAHPEGCRAAERTLSLGRALYLADEKDFVAAVTEALGRVHGAGSYNYLAVLIAALSGDGRFVKPLARLAALEKSKAIAFPYATRALERLQTGGCVISEDSHFREICAYRDQEFDRIRLLKGKPPGAED